jgi:hypothetical protein
MRAKIYKITVTKAYRMDEQGEGYSLKPWEGDNIDYSGYDDGGKLYELPEGYEVAESTGAGLQIYGPDGKHCILGKKFESPCIYGYVSEIMLKQSKEEA